MTKEKEYISSDDRAKYQELVTAGTNVLVGAFSSAITELFQKPLVILKDNSNPFSELPTHIQLSIVQGAFHKGLAQSLASMAMLSGGQATDKEVFSAGATVLKHFYTLYLKEFREDYAKHQAMGKGHQGKHELHGDLSGGELGPAEDEDGEPVRSGENLG